MRFGPGFAGALLSIWVAGLAAAQSGAPMDDAAAVERALAASLADLRVAAIEGPALEVHFIDVGQGDSILIRAPQGKTVLIDTGPPDAKDELLAYLKAHGVARLDLLVNTHPHSDHIGNATAVIEALPVGRVLDSGFVHPTTTYERMLDAIEKRAIPLRVVRKGQRIVVEDGVTLTALGPEEPLVEKSRSDANANSVVLRLDHGSVRFMLTGDAEEETEERLVKQGADALRSTVLKVAHHGSKYATHDAFFEAVAPRLAVVSCAAQNSYGHPAAETMDRLHAKKVPILATPPLGNIVIRTDGKKLQIGYGRTLPAPVATGDDAGKLDLNTATPAELETLPGIGETLAKRIVDWRAANGRFASVEDLTKVSGIGAATLEKLRPLVTAR
ncbi:MAG: helix-hairpin-helix domain-containing protein [bacterium]